MTRKINFPKLKLLDFFKVYIQILSSFPPVYVLRPKEKDLLALILCYNYKYKDLDLFDRAKIIFDTKTKLDMLKELKCSIGSLNNNISILRKHQFIDDNNVLNKSWSVIIPDDSNSVVFNLDLDNGS